MVGQIVIYFTEYFIALFELLRDLWIWLLLGFVIAGLIAEFVPTRRILKYFGKNNLSSLIRATMSGFFLSVCSCSAIPIAAGLRRRGASVATSLTFLLAAPWAGFIHIFILLGFIGMPKTLVLVAFSLALALTAGLILAAFENKQKIEQKIIIKHKAGEKELCVECLEREDMIHAREPFLRRLSVCAPKNTWNIFSDIGKYIFLGLFIAAGLKAFVSVDLITQYLGAAKGMIGILTAIPLAAVIEMASEGFTILAGQLYTMGASLAVVFTITIVGVATDFTELSMIWGKFGKKTALVYLLVATVLTILFAFVVSFMF